VVAEGIAERGVDAVEPLLRLLDELDALGLQLVVRRPAVVGLERAEAQVPAGDHAAQLPGDRLLDHRRLGHDKHHRQLRAARRVDGEPAEPVHLPVDPDLEAEDVDVEALGLVEVEDVEADQREPRDHGCPA
jgi:hypothetical protein